MKQNNLESMEKNSEMFGKDKKEEIHKQVEEAITAREKQDKLIEDKVTKIVDSRLEKFEKRIDDSLKHMEEKINGENQPEESKGINSWLNKRPVVALIISVIISLAGNQIVSFIYSFVSLPTKVNQLVEQQMTAYFESEENININEEEKSLVEGKNPLVEEENSYEVASLRAVKPAERYLQPKEISYNMISLGNPLWSGDDIVAEEIGDDKKYTAEEAIGIPMLVPYVDGKYNILFYGQYNEQYFWDGVCTINVYEGDKLYLITEATYDKGNIKSYKQIIQDESESSSKKEWIIADRNNEGGSNSGTSITYSRKDDYTKQYNEDDVSKENLLMFDDFKKIIENSDETITKCYHGDTSGGYYNDASKNAYLVEYTEDGYVQMLYQGNFENGDLIDGSGDAWYIVKDGNGLYGYFKGEFDDEGRVETETNKPKVVYYNEISGYVDESLFDCELKWYDNGMRRKQ